MIICTHERAPLFGRVVDGEMVVNECGEIVREEWFRTARVRSYVALHANEFVVMPNHIHGIVWIVETGDWRNCRRSCVGATGRSPLQVRPRGPAPCSLGAFVAGFKSAVTRRANTLRDAPGAPVWQRNYYEHIIRSERALNAIRRYIADNPLRWHLDRYNPGRVGNDPLARDLWRLLHADDRAHPHGRGAAPLRL